MGCSFYNIETYGSIFVFKKNLKSWYETPNHIFWRIWNFIWWYEIMRWNYMYKCWFYLSFFKLHTSYRIFKCLLRWCSHCISSYINKRTIQYAKTLVVERPVVLTGRQFDRRNISCLWKDWRRAPPHNDMRRLYQESDATLSRMVNSEILNFARNVKIYL